MLFVVKKLFRYPMSRPKKILLPEVISIRFSKEEYDKIKAIAALESINRGRTIFAAELIRDAVHFVYSDNERLRECFKRSRSVINKRMRYNT
jgi:hypothetical protein